MHHEYFPEELISLRQEIDHHPDLLTILAGQADKDVYVQIAEIAAYCGIVLDGMYTRDDIIGLCDKCIKALQAKRISIIISI